MRDAKPSQFVAGVNREALANFVEGLPADYRPAWLHVEGMGDRQRWSAVWTKGSRRLAWRAEHDLDLAALQRHLGENRAIGLRPTTICGYASLEDPARYAATWIEDGRRYDAEVHLSEQELRERLGSLPNHWRPDWIASFRENGQRWFNAIFVEDAKVVRWRLDTDVPQWVGQQHFNRVGREGFLLQTHLLDAPPVADKTPIVARAAERGRELAQAGRWERADETLSEAFQQAPGDPRVARDLADAKLMRGQWNAAAGVLSEFFLRRPRSSASVASQPNSNSPAGASTRVVAAADSVVLGDNAIAFGWWISGPYPPQAEGPWPPGTDDAAWRDDSIDEESAPPRAPEPDVWRRLISFATGDLNLDLRMSDAPGIYFVRQHIYAAREHDAVLQVARDPGLRMYLNAELIREGTAEVSGLAPLVHVKLRSGWNVLVARLVVPRQHRLVARWQTESSSLASLYSYHNEFEKACEEWTNVIEKEEDDYAPLVARGAALVRLNRFAEAAADFERAAKLRPNDPDSRLQLAGVFAAQLASEKGSTKESADGGVDSEREQLTRRALAALGEAVELGSANSLNAAAILADNRFQRLHDHRGFQDLVLEAVDEGDVSDAIFYGFGELTGGYWASGQSMQSLRDFIASEESFSAARPRFLSVDQRGRKAIFAAAAMSDGKPFHVDWDVDWSTVEKRRRELPEGFHPTSFDIFRRGRELRYAVVWTRDEVPVPWELHLDMDIAELERKLGELAKREFRPALVGSYRDLADRLRFLAVCVQDGAACETLFDLDRDALQAKLDVLGQTAYPAWIDAYVVDGRRRYAAIFLSDGRTVDWKTTLGRSSVEIHERINEIRGSGFWPARQTTTLDPASPQPALERAELLERFRRSDEALAELNGAIERLPDRHELLLARARLLAKRGEVAAADASYAAAMRIRPEDEQLQIERGKLLAEGDKIAVVPAGSTWHWLHPTDGVDPAAHEPDFQRTFFEADYDDSRWQTGRDGAGGLGYGDRVAVNIGAPSVGQRWTAYFRHRFTTEQPLKELVLSLQRDDGIIVYLDGVEVARDNMRPGPDAYDLVADENVTSGADESRTINLKVADSLAPGDHLLAISLHNRSEASGDLRIERIELRGQGESATVYSVEDAAQLASRGAHYQQQGDLRSAEADFSEALAKVPDDATVALRRARLRTSQNRWREAIADFDVAVGGRPEDAALLVERALAHGQIGARAAALADLSAATRMRPDDVQFRRQQGQLYALLDSNVIVPPATSWKWLHPVDGVDPATTDPDFHATFARADFDDTAWNVGASRPGIGGGFGYGKPHAVTIGVPPLEMRHTAYFRHKFTTDAAYDRLQLNFFCDDGAVVYLDGEEVARVNVRPGADSYRLAAASTSDPGPAAIAVRRTLAPGEHVLAISVHNVGTTSSDLVLAGVTLLGARTEEQETSLDDPEALAARAEQFVQLGQVERALADYTALVERAPDEAQPLLDRAEMLFDNNRWEQALADYELLSKRFEPRRHSHYSRRHRCLTSLRRWADARAALTEALAVASPGVARGNDLIHRGVCWAEEGEFAKAAEDCSAALEEAADNLDDWNLRNAAVIFAVAGQPQRFQQSRELLLKRVAAGDRDYVNLRKIVLMPLTANEVGAVEEYLTYPSVRSEGVLSGALYRLGRFQEAVDAIEDSTHHYYEYRFVRALALFGLGKVGEAREALDRANDKLREDIAASGGRWRPTDGAFYDWARVLVWQREANETIVVRPLAEVTKALEAAPDNPKLLAERANIYAYSGRRDEAFADLDRLLKTNPGDAENLALRGDLRAGEGNWDAAAADYFAAARRQPNDAAVLGRIDRLVREAWLTPLAADAERTPTRWRYTTIEPADDYSNLDFDDAGWKSGDAPFATTADAANAVMGRTLWGQGEKDIWLRRKFELDDAPQDTLVVRFRFDDIASVRINGVVAGRWGGSGEYGIEVASADAAATLKRGENQLAVHAANNDGPGYCDVGLYVTPAPRRALEVLDAIVAAHPKAVEARRKRAELLVLLDRHEAAAADIAAVIETEKWQPQGAWNARMPKVIEDVARRKTLFDAVMKLRPDDAALWIARARVVGRGSEWKAAIAAIREAIRVNPNDLDSYRSLAVVLAEIGDEPAYRRVCQEITARFARSNTARRADLASKSCLLLAGGVDDLTAVRTLAKESVDLALARPEGENKGLLPWFYFCHALGEYRAGDDDQAAAALSKAIADPGVWDVCKSTSQIVLAMVRHRQGRTEEAKRLLAEADAERAEWARRHDASDLGDGWWDPLVVRILRREAEQVEK